MTELEIQQARERYQNMRLIDNELMNIAFKDNPQAVEYVIQIILNKKDLKIKDMDIQSVQALPNNNRSVILDMLAIDREGKLYNLELQTQPKYATGLRARYHFSTLDNTQLNKGEDFSLLPETYVIFITDGPFLNLKDVPIEFYVRKGINTGLRLDDKQTVVFVDASSKQETEELTRLMQDLTARSDKEIVAPILKKAVQYAKGTRGEKMYIEGYLPNQEELIQATTLSTKKECVINCFKNGLPLELISKCVKLPLDEVKMLLNEN